MFFWRSDVAGLRRAVTDRSGGVSEPPYAGLNLGGHVGDASDAVRENRARLAVGIGVDPDRLVLMDQCHGADVAVEDPTGRLAAWARAARVVEVRPDRIVRSARGRPETRGSGRAAAGRQPA